MKQGVVFASILAALIIIEYMHKNAKEHEQTLKYLFHEHAQKVPMHDGGDHLFSYSHNQSSRNDEVSPIHQHIKTLEDRLHEMSRSAISKQVLENELDHIRQHINKMRDDMKQEKGADKNFEILQKNIDALEHTYEHKFKLLQKRIAQVLEEHLSTTHMLIAEEIKTVVDPIREKLHALSCDVQNRGGAAPAREGVDRREISHMIRRSIQKNLRRLEDRQIFDEID